MGKFPPVPVFNDIFLGMVQIAFELTSVQFLNELRRVASALPALQLRPKWGHNDMGHVSLGKIVRTKPDQQRVHFSWDFGHLGVSVN